MYLIISALEIRSGSTNKPSELSDPVYVTYRIPLMQTNSEERHSLGG